MYNNEKKDPNKKDRSKDNKAIKRANTIKGIAKGLKGVKVISNALGTQPTDTPEVDTKFIKTYDDDGSTGNNESESDYKLDENGVGSLVNKAATPNERNLKRRLGR